MPYYLSLSLSLLQLNENALLEQLAEHERALLFGTQTGKFWHAADWKD